MTGSLSPTGFSHGKYAYEIGNPTGSPTLLGDDWILDSAFVSPEGDLRPKRTDDYKTSILFDVDGDGVFETEETALVYDLRYEHRVHSGVIWLRTVPISNTLRQKELRVLMQDYVDGVAGAGYELVNVGEKTAMIERRYAADIVSRGPGTLGGKPSFAVDFGVANIDQVQVKQDARRTRVMVVISRPGFEHEVRQGTRVELAHFPVLFIAGYSSLPEDFEKGLVDFESLLKRVRFDGQSGYTTNWETPPDAVAADGETTQASTAAPPSSDNPETEAAAEASPTPDGSPVEQE